MSKGITIDIDVAERITLASMKDHLSYLKEELKQYKKGETYMHPEDAANSELHLIPSFETLIKYYGG